MLNNNLPQLSEFDDWELVNDEQDLRGCPLKTRSGQSLGIIRRMLVDRDAERVAAVVLDDGRAIPVEEIEIRDGEAFIDIDDAALAAAPQMPPRNDETVREERIPIVEEEMAVGKRMVERGHVRVRSRIVEKPVDETISLREERVTIERKPVDRPVKDGEKLLQDRDVEVIERSEEPVVEKRARVTDEVVVQKDVRERTEDVHDTVRRTEVDIDKDKGDERPAIGGGGRTSRT